MLNWLEQIVIGIILGLLVINFVVAQHVIEPTHSMNPALLGGERVLVDKISFRLGLRPLRPGDIISFRRSDDIRGAKRLIALGGQRVQIKGCFVYVDGRPLTDDAFNHPGHPDPQRRCYYNRGIMSANNVELVVPQGHYFVLGDNSSSSYDSRYPEVGFIKENEVIGRYWFRFWPLATLWW